MKRRPGERPNDAPAARWGSSAGLPESNVAPEGNTGATMRIVTVEPDSQLLADVVSLGRQNARTLGFFPQGAFHDYAARGHIRACVDDGCMAGYLAFRTHNLTVVLVHLCVGHEARGRGIARALVNHLREESSGFAGIRAKCRVDYPADAMWPHLGFVVRNEIPGRATRASTTLRVWCLDLGLPDLFSTAPSDRLIAALDTNVVLDLHSDSDAPQLSESKALLAPWLEDSIEYVVTGEFHAEVSRNPVHDERQAILDCASAFRTLPGQITSSTQAFLTQLSQVIGPGESPQDRSDRHHMALAATGGAHFFVTRDESLLDAAPAIDKGLGLAVVRPCDLIARTHTELTERSFADRRLSGSALSIRPFGAGDIDNLVETFQAFDQREKKGAFVGALRDCLAHSDRSQGLVVLGQDGNPRGLLVTASTANETTVQLLRATRGTMGKVIARHLLWLAVQEARRVGHRVTRLIDNHIPVAASGVLGVLGFRPAKEGMAKVNGIHVSSTFDLAGVLRSARPIYDEHVWVEDTANALERDGSGLPQQLAFECERVTWPSKLLDTRLPSFVVPIHPEWAAQLFHSQLADQSLFGADPRLMLRLDNVYYRSALPKCIEAPARVLWYVTASKERPSTKCIAATSLVSEVVNDSAKRVFARFKRYGVFRWADVLEVAGGDPYGPIQAFRFGHTEPFQKPVGLKRLRNLARQSGAGLMLQSPSRVPSELFGAIYQEGIGLRE